MFVFGHRDDSEKHHLIIRGMVPHCCDPTERIIRIKVRVIELNQHLVAVNRLGGGKEKQPAAQNEREAEDEFRFHGLPDLASLTFNRDVLSLEKLNKFDATNVPRLSLCL